MSNCTFRGSRAADFVDSSINSSKDVPDVIMFVKMKGIDVGSRDVLDFFEANNFEWLMRVTDDRLGLDIRLGHGTWERSN